MGALRQRQTGRDGQPPYPVHVDRVEADTDVVPSDSPIDPDGPLPFPVATGVTVTNGKVTQMQQYRTEAKSASQA
jgi:hypothetical protein